MPESTLLNHFKWKQNYITKLPADPDDSNYPRQVLKACYTRVNPEKAPAPKLVAYSLEMAEELGLSKEICESMEFLDIFSGNLSPEGSETFAINYGGHQFGNWAGQLGDGRAINLGEVETPNGEHLALQLKGAGPTPYSRMGDGYAVLRSSIREFLCSEAMHHLGVPTTRALCVLESGESVMRDMFYDGNVQAEPGAIVCRVAPTFTRFGNFQIFNFRQETEVLKTLLDYTIEHHFPHLGKPCEDTYLKWFEEVCRRNYEMVTHWMRVGFVHGVMNTDNMSVLGLTIDYGPYGFLDEYDPSFTPNTTDSHMKRYCYAAQPEITSWNLCRLGDAILPLIKDIQSLEEIITKTSTEFGTNFEKMMLSKLGLTPKDPEDDTDLLRNINLLLQAHEVDYTLFFRFLATLDFKSEPNTQEVMKHFDPAIYKKEDLPAEFPEILYAFVKRYARRSAIEDYSKQSRSEIMKAVNPLYIPRNYLAQQAIDAAHEGDYSKVHRLLDVLRKPYENQEGAEDFEKIRPEWARHKAGCSRLSCSS